MRFPAIIVALLLTLPLMGADCGPYGPEGDKDACVTCHGGIEHAHTPIDAERCSICHGGDPTTRDKDRAHVPIPANYAEVRGEGLPAAPPGFIRDFAPDQLDAIGPDYLQFINPGDLRVLDRTCGTCHPDQAASMPMSVMCTNVGHYFPTLLLAGQQDDRLGHYGSYAVSDPDCDTSIEGAICEVETLTPPTQAEVDAAFAAGTPSEDVLLDIAYRNYLSKNCNTCHQAGFPRNNSPGLYRSSGCSACHFVYAEDGAYTGGDPTIPTGTPTHPVRHEITSAIPVEQCASCHFQGGRIGLLYRGIREGGFSGQNPENGESIDRTLYGHTPPYYWTDEDISNDIDETPADVHYRAGMACVDCHVGQDVHGSGAMVSSSKQQVTLRCEDCHGDVREPARPGADGTFKSYKGNDLKQLRLDGEQVLLAGKLSGRDHVVPQVSELLAPDGDGSAAMKAAMGPNGDDWAHPDSLTCDTCHTTHLQYCIGCHVSVDFRVSQVDYQTGLPTPGLTSGSRKTYTMDHLLLGTAPDGRVQTVHPSQQVQLSMKNADGEVIHGAVLDDGEGGTTTVGRFRHADGSEANNGFIPFMQHTVQDTARPCSDCHRRADTPEEWARIRGVYGFGTGEFLLRADDGSWVDGMKFLDADGNPLTTWVHEGTGPVSPERRERAMAIELGP